MKHFNFLRTKNLCHVSLRPILMAIQRVLPASCFLYATPLWQEEGEEVDIFFASMFISFAY